MSLIFDRLRPLSARDLNKIHCATVDDSRGGMCMALRTVEEGFDRFF